MLFYVLVVMSKHFEVHDGDVVSKNEMKEKNLSVRQMEEGEDGKEGKEGEDGKEGKDGGTSTNSNALFDDDAELKPREEDSTEHIAKYSSKAHNNNRVAFQSLKSLKKQKKIERHERNSRIKVTDLNYFKDEVKRNHNSHVHRVGSFANKAYYTYFSYHPSIRHSAWVFHNAHHGVRDGWRDYYE